MRARRKRSLERQGRVADSTLGAQTPESPSGSGRIGREPSRGDLTAIVLAIAVFLAPALGVPHEEMLQDTLKSIVVSFAALIAALLFFWRQRSRMEPLRWHALLWLPLLLTAYALVSMAWSHTYLGAVEAIRWFIFSLLLWLGLNALSRERLPLLAWGIHGGAVVASLWTALQFWFEFNWFPQGPNPASTFVNRNFFAEFAACTLPFSALLLARARQRGLIAGLAVSTGLVIVAILMTGTRSALAAMWLQLLLVLPLVFWRCRSQLAFMQWDGFCRVLAIGLLLTTVVSLGGIATGNRSIQQELRGSTALERGFKRSASISTSDESLGIRKVMWNATARMIQARPLSGVGAGAWESEIPLYQTADAQLETDFYVHNEFLQLLAEYGLAGWIFLLLLAAYLLSAAWRTWRDRTPTGLAEAPFRAIVLTSLLALMIVSNIGFPWRMATTGAIFALCLGALAASDARLGFGGWWAASGLRWRPAFSQAGLLGSLVGLALAAFISVQAARAESSIVQATRIALAIAGSGDPRHPRFDGSKAEVLRLITEGVAINPHYRKITPIVADELARWGDWRNATWVWESVLASRPYVVAILTNAARGHVSTGNPARALEYLERARALQPGAPAVRSLEIIMLSRTGQAERALVLAREAIAASVVDYDLLNTAFLLAWRGGDFPLALRAMQLRMANFPESAAAGHLQLGNLYSTGLKDPEKALASFRRAAELTPPSNWPALRAQMPEAAWQQLGLAATVPAATTQMSVISK